MPGVYLLCLQMRAGEAFEVAELIASLDIKTLQRWQLMCLLYPVLFDDETL